MDLADPEEACSYLNAALEDSEKLALVALRDVAEARQMAKVAKDAGVSREALYRMLSESGNPTFSNLSAILGSVGLKITVSTIGHRADEERGRVSESTVGHPRGRSVGGAAKKRRGPPLRRREQ
jgi:probable addiction module antidote protein